MSYRQAVTNIRRRRWTGPNRVAFLQSGKADMVVSIFGITPERAKAVAFSIPYGTLKAVIFGTRASADLRANIARLIAAHKPWVELREVVEVPFSYDLQVRPLLGAAAAGVHATPH